MRIKNRTVIAVIAFVYSLMSVLHILRLRRQQQGGHIEHLM